MSGCFERQRQPGGPVQCGQHLVARLFQAIAHRVYNQFIIFNYQDCWQRHIPCHSSPYYTTNCHGPLYEPVSGMLQAG
jgi:hypothetical protein